MDEVTYELWDCTNCGMTGISGKLKNCPRIGCGDPQSTVLDGEAYYRSDNPEKVTDEVELARAELPSWNCGYDNVHNTGDLDRCRECGRPKDADDTVNRRITYDDQAPHYDTMPEWLDERIESDADKAERIISGQASVPRVMDDLVLPMRDIPMTGRDTELFESIREDADRRFRQKFGDPDADGNYSARPSSNGRLASVAQLLGGNIKPLAIGAVVLVAVILAIVFGVQYIQYMTATRPGTVSVSKLHWERQVEVEELKTLTQADWSHPGDARVMNTESKIRSYRTVHDGWHMESYTDYETRYRMESYTDNETHYRSESYGYECGSYTSNGNGTGSYKSRTCTGSRQVSYTVPVQKTKQVAYQVAVPKTRQVEDTHEEPVFAPWYTYQIDRWSTDRWVIASDATYDKVVWPEVADLYQNDQPGDQVGEEKVGDVQKESYTIVYKDEQDVLHSEVSEDDAMWRLLEVEEPIKARYYEHNGQLTDVDWSSVS